ncbi:putative DNA-3-methyladenine glycosylase [Aspergillus taichungensis]|uniref:Putative DNA-3-methyladenine glycosylase n=1 Tax=Aspergillus taichungensis TaxID=482145 RepID=A0A2J5HFW5_9EURO|nr:putative DNA-3-methyladenine glycosylase [Aspergillus taichungensis]
MMAALRRSARLSVTSDTKASLNPSVQPNKRGKTQRSSSGINKPPRKALAKGSGRQAKVSISDIEQASSAQASLEDTPAAQSTPNKQGHSANYWDPSSPSTSRINSTPPPLDRPVEPHRTNATLLTPHGSSLVAYPAAAETPSPSKTSRPRRPSPLATTGTLLEKAVAHLIATDPRLEPVIKQYPCPLFSPEGLAEQVDPFRSLVSSIIGQQVSGAAAKSIKEKFVALFRTGAASSSSSGDSNSSSSITARKDYFPTPEEISRCDIAVLRTAGLSQRKAEYILGLAEKFASGELSARMLLDAEDEELLATLTAVRGLGRWSVEMFACFALKRLDVFSTGDLGVQRGCAAFVGKDVSKLKAKGGGKFKYMPEKEMLEVAAKFAPYRSLFMWYMWRIENVDVAVLR